MSCGGFEPGLAQVTLGVDIAPITHLYDHRFECSKRTSSLWLRKVEQHNPDLPVGPCAQGSSEAPVLSVVDMAEQGFKDAYRDELKRLTHPEKALINMLSMLAEDNKPQAPAIVTALELHLHEVCIQIAA